ncbi:MAG: S8 family serine peptidase [Pseudobdellovibrionaceae bacterium]
MSFLSRLSGIVSLFAMSALVAVSAHAQVSPSLNRTEREKEIDAEAVPGEFLVTLKSDVSVQERNLQSLYSLIGSHVKSTIPFLNIAVVSRPSFELQQTSVDLLKENPLVLRVTPNFVYRANKLPNDVLFEKLWGLKNTGQTDTKQTGTAGIDIGAEQAWDLTTGSKDIIVAVIDTGINYNHPDLAPNMWTNSAEKNGAVGVDDDGNGFVDDIHGYNFVSNNGNPLDDQGHGSHCAGTIGGRGNDGEGVAGVTWESQLMAVKFLGADGSGTLENAVKSIAYATQMGAKILSNSWGGGGFSQELKDVIEASNQAGTIFVAAAGNSSSNNDSAPGYPASYDVANIISVAAIDNRGALASFSSYGKKKVHVGAPGVNVLSVTMKGFEAWSGTSMATPHVSGIAALLWSFDNQLTNTEIKNRLISTAVPLASLRNKVASGGLAHAWTALNNILPPPDLNDPALWQTQAFEISTAHPYASNTVQTWEISIPEAKEMALYFSKFDLENRYDFLEVYDASGKLLTKYSGGMDESFSDAIQGNYVKIVFKSDNIINNYGFDLTKVAFR